MKKPSNKGKKQGPTPPKIIRHYKTLSAKETDEVVEGVAELIGNFVKKGGLKSGIANPGGTQEPDSTERPR